MPTPRQIKRFGWDPDHPDHRDRILTVTKPVALPAAIDLRKTGFMPPVYDQKQLGSCTANATAAAVDFERAKQGLPFITPARLWIYYQERKIEGTVDQDAGAEIRDGIKVLANLGVCPETDWPYDETTFAIAPPPKDYTDALANKALQYSSVTQAPYYIKHCLAILGRPVVFGIAVYDQIQSDECMKTGMVTMPGPNDSPIGGHAICLVGYDDSKSLFTFRNSWGADFGDAGYGFLPYSYVLNPDLASDFWVVLMES